MLPAIHYRMKKLILTLVFLSFIGFSEGQSIFINIDSVKLIRIIDHQNFNYEWYCGRVYEITSEDGEFKMYRSEQYSKPFFFGEPVENVQEDSIDISQSKLLTKFEINKDSAVDLANRAAASKHNYWANRITVENTNEYLKISEFDEQKLFQLIESINDSSSRSPWKILDNLGMDSLWIAQNAQKLFELYKMPDVEPTPEQKEFCLSCFFDRKKTLIAGYTLTGGPNTSDYPYIEIQFIGHADTLSLSTTNPYPLSLPWLIDDSVKYYNPNISIILSELLPDSEYSNKKRLSRNNSYPYSSIEEAFAKSLIRRNCTKFNGKRNRKRGRIYISEGKAGNSR
jgi:hypothetical protein